MSTLRFGVVGLGFGQHVHVPALRSIPGCEVAAICGRDAGRARAAAERLTIPRAYDDWRALVEDFALDAITIAVPPAEQPPIALAALAAGRHVFCEKPLATSVESASALVGRAADAGVANMVDFELPELELWLQARSLVVGGAIGRIRRVAVSWHVETYAVRHQLVSWKTTVGEGGGTLNNFVSHVFHYLEWFLGPVARLACHLVGGGPDRGAGDRLVRLWLTFESGATADVTVSSDGTGRPGHHVAFYGDDGTIILDNTGRDYVRGFILHVVPPAGETTTVEATNESGGTADGRIDAVARMIGRFAGWIRDGTPARPSFADGMRVEQLIEAARCAHRQSGWVACSQRV